MTSTHFFTFVTHKFEKNIKKVLLIVMVLVLSLSCESNDGIFSDKELTKVEEIIALGTPVSLAKVFGVESVKTVCSGEWGGGSATVFENKKGDVFVHVHYPNGSVITTQVYVSSSYMCSVLFNNQQ